MKIREVNSPQNAHAVCWQLSFFYSQECVSLKNYSKRKQVLIIRGGRRFLFSNLACCCQRRKEVNSVEGIECFQLLWCIHIGHFFISIIRLKAKVPTFRSIHPANIKLLRSSLGIYCIPVLSTCTGCCFDLSGAVRSFRKIPQW